MRFSTISIFPEMFSALTQCGVTAQAYAKSLYQLFCINPRDFSNYPHQRVDDTPFGGGPGMVMMPEPLKQSLVHIHQTHGKSHVVLLSPQGRVWSQSMAREYQQKHAHITLICGRYEGVDQRFIDQYVDEECSIGSFVISGGELAAMVLMDSMIRLIPGALGNALSAPMDSFYQNDEFDYPQYTKPRDFDGQVVPEVLLSGHHENITQWRNAQAQAKKQAMLAGLHLPLF